MTHLQKITTLAKKIRKQHPSKKWTDCVKAASKELKAGKKVAGYTGTRKDGNKTTVSYTTKKVTAKKPAKATQAKLFGTSKKHTDTKSHNVKIRIMSGIESATIENVKNLFEQIKKAENQYQILKDKKKINKKLEGFDLKLYNRYPNYIKSLKKQLTEAKKNIK